MGTIKKGILGSFSGAVGPAVGSSWKGITVIKSRPPRRRRKSSEAQLAQMAKLKLMTPFVRPLTDLLNRTYACVTTVYMSCFNRALSYNMRNAVTGDYPALTVSYPRFKLGIGDLTNPDIISVDSVSEGKLRFCWIDNSRQGSAKATDRLFVAVYCEDLNHWETSVQGSQRNAGSYILDVVALSGKAVHSYIGFLSADGRFVSTSVYTGLVNIL